jgi:Fe2+ or Zn2+ uptake regulation protein
MRLNWDPNAAQTLRAAGLKATPQRLAILRALDGDETHPTAQELFERLHDEFPTLSVATVYNTLSALTRMGRCAPLELGGPLRFDPNMNPHDHAVCESCGRIRDVSHPQWSSPPQVTQVSDSRVMASHASELSGFQIKRVERIYRGLCAHCVRAAESVVE